MKNIDNLDCIEEYYEKYEDTYFYEDDFEEDDFEEDYYDDPSEFVPSIEDTELEFGITFQNFNYFPIITSRFNNGIRKYYLFDFIKIWQCDDNTSY